MLEFIIKWNILQKNIKNKIFYRLYFFIFKLTTRYIDKTNNYNSSYESKMSLDELLNEYSRKNSTKKQLEEKPKSLFDKFKSIFKK